MRTKVKRPTKKQIVAELRSLDCTRIHRIAARCGIDANKEYSVKEFCKEYAPSKKLYNHISAIISTRGLDRFVCSFGKCENNLIRRICCEMRAQIKPGMFAYSKILIEGIEYIYWASPRYGLFDHNKSIAMPNTARNLKIMNLVNNHLAKNGIK